MVAINTEATWGTGKLPKEYKEIKNTIQEQREEIGKMNTQHISARDLQYRMIQKNSPQPKRKIDGEEQQLRH